MNTTFGLHEPSRTGIHFIEKEEVFSCKIIDCEKKRTEISHFFFLFLLVEAIFFREVATQRGNRYPVCEIGCWRQGSHSLFSVRHNHFLNVIIWKGDSFFRPQATTTYSSGEILCVLFEGHIWQYIMPWCSSNILFWKYFCGWGGHRNQITISSMSPILYDVLRLFKRKIAT